MSVNGLREIPKEIENLIQLRHLDLSRNDLREIPREIGNLIYLKTLDLSSNLSLEGLPDSICGLLEMRTLDVTDCKNLRGLPQGIHTLVNLRGLRNCNTDSLHYPQGLAQLTGLRTLDVFRGGNGRSKLGLLKNLNSLTGRLILLITLTGEDGVVEDASEAELWEKIHIERLEIFFEDEMDEKEWSRRVRMEVIDALKPHPNLPCLKIMFYKGSKLPSSNGEHWALI